MKFLVECTAFAVDTPAPDPVREEHVLVDATDRQTALTAARTAIRAAWPELRDPRAGVMVAAPRPIFLSVGHAISFMLHGDLAYLIGYMVADGDEAMELDYAAGYITTALYGGVDAAVDWQACDTVIKPRVAAAMVRFAAALRAAATPEELLC